MSVAGDFGGAMVPSSLVLDLFRHMAWADASVWTGVAACEPARADASLRERLYHLHVVQRAFLRTWRAEPRDTPYPSFDDTLSLAAWARTGGANEIYEAFWRYGARDFRDIGHKAIFVANSYRTLQTIGWRHAEPILRSRPASCWPKSTRSS